MRLLRAVVALGLVAAALTACSRDSESSLPMPSKAFCQAAYDYDTNLPKLIGKINQQTDLVREARRARAEGHRRTTRRPTWTR